MAKSNDPVTYRTRLMYSREPYRRKAVPETVVEVISEDTAGDYGELASMLAEFVGRIAPGEASTVLGIAAQHAATDEQETGKKNWRG